MWSSTVHDWFGLGTLSSVIQDGIDNVFWPIISGLFCLSRSTPSVAVLSFVEMFVWWVFVMALCVFGSGNSAARSIYLVIWISKSAFVYHKNRWKHLDFITLPRLGRGPLILRHHCQTLSSRRSHWLFFDVDILAGRKGQWIIANGLITILFISSLHPLHLYFFMLSHCCILV